MLDDSTTWFVVAYLATGALAITPHVFEAARQREQSSLVTGLALLLAVPFWLPALVIHSIMTWRKLINKSSKNRHGP